jgi:magnesium chelatase subunit I
MHRRIAAEGDATPVAWLRDARYVEAGNTGCHHRRHPWRYRSHQGGPQRAAIVRRADDPLRVATRASRGIFGINELPDLAGKIQVGLFNILQGDVQIKGYPVRLKLDVLLVFTANPEDYTARGKIITPLKDRIGSEIRTHYPANRRHAMEITAQEAWLARGTNGEPIDVPPYVREVVEEIAFQARADRKIDRRSGVSQRLAITCLENALSNAERRALANHEHPVVARVRRLCGAAVDHR